MNLMSTVTGSLWEEGVPLGCVFPRFGKRVPWDVGAAGDCSASLWGSQRSPQACLLCVLPQVRVRNPTLR